MDFLLLLRAWIRPRDRSEEMAYGATFQETATLQVSPSCSVSYQPALSP